MIIGHIQVLPQLWLAWQRNVGALQVDDVAARAKLQSARARQAAARAVSLMGATVPSFINSPSGAPQFGQDLSGSLAHADEFAAAVVGSALDWSAVGVDIEPSRPMPDDALHYALDPTEQAALAALPGGLNHWAIAAFGLKESLHKCLSPRYGLTLEFNEVRVELNSDGALLRLSPQSVCAAEALMKHHWVGGVHRADGAVISWLAASI